MKIVQNKIDDLNLELTLTVAGEDYAESRKKRLADFRKKAEIKGFRKGMVPMSLVLDVLLAWKRLTENSEIVLLDIVVETLRNCIVY